MFHLSIILAKIMNIYNFFHIYKLKYYIKIFLRKCDVTDNLLNTYDDETIKTIYDMFNDKYKLDNGILCWYAGIIKHYYHNDIDKALVYYNRAYTEFNNDNVLYNLVVTYIIKSRMCDSEYEKQICNNNASLFCEIAVQKLFSETINVDNKNELYAKIVKLYIKNGDFHNAIKYLLLITEHNDIKNLQYMIYCCHNFEYRYDMYIWLMSLKSQELKKHIKLNIPDNFDTIDGNFKIYYNKCQVCFNDNCKTLMYNKNNYCTKCLYKCKNIKECYTINTKYFSYSF